MKFLDCKSAHEFLELTGLSAEEALKIADRELNELKGSEKNDMERNIETK